MNPSRSWRRYQLSSGSRMIGNSGSPAAARSAISGTPAVTRYWCSIGATGSSAPIIAPISRHQAPAALTTCRQRTVSRSVCTAHAPEASRSIARTGVWRRISAPRERASCGECLGGQRRVDVPVVRLVDRAEQPLDAGQGIDPRQRLGGEDAELVAHEPPEPLHVAELGHPLGRARDAERAAGVEPGRLPGLRRQHVPVQAHRFRAHRHDRGVVGEVGAEPGRVPGRARGQLALLQEHDVAPATPGQVPGERGAHDAAAHDHRLRIGRHRRWPSDPPNRPRSSGDHRPPAPRHCIRDCRGRPRWSGDYTRIPEFPGETSAIDRAPARPEVIGFPPAPRGRRPRRGDRPEQSSPFERRRKRGMATPGHKWFPRPPGTMRHRDLAGSGLTLDADGLCKIEPGLHVRT